MFRFSDEAIEYFPIFFLLIIPNTIENEFTHRKQCYNSQNKISKQVIICKYNAITEIIIVERS